MVSRGLRTKSNQVIIKIRFLMTQTKNAFNLRINREKLDSPIVYPHLEPNSKTTKFDLMP